MNIRQTLVGFALCVGFAACAADLTLGTYNIRNGVSDKFKNTWAARRQVVCDLINYEAPLVLGVQEAYRFQIDDMLKAMPEYACVGVGRDDGKEKGEHSPVFYDKTRVRCLESGTFWLSETPDAPSKSWDAFCKRICSWGRFKLIASGREFFVYNVHMDHKSSLARENGAKLMLARMGDALAKKIPVFAMGDFNADVGSEAYNVFTNAGLRDAYKAARFRFAPNGTTSGFDEERWSVERIDHVFVTPGVTVNRYAILTAVYWEPEADEKPDHHGYYDFDVRTPSDHYPVFVKVQF